MFRCGLLATTAFVVVGSLSFLALQSAVIAQPVKIEAARDRNHEFLSNYCGEYGWLAVTAVWNSSHYPSVSSGWTHVAVAVTGHGKTVDRIIVREEGWPLGTFSAGIYSNTPSHLPGKLIAGGTGHPPSSECGKTTISISPTLLKKNRKYWIEETDSAFGGSSDSNAMAWIRATHSQRPTYAQSHWWRKTRSGSSSSTTSWQRQTYTPFVRLK